MKTTRSRSSRFASRLAVRALYGLAIALFALQVGCASPLPDGQLAAFEGMRGPITSFSKHPMVCAPTSVGNAVGGLIGAPLALAVYPFVWPATLFTEDDDYLFQAYGTTFWGPVLLVGGATGGLFLPPAMLFKEDVCFFGTSEVAKGDAEYDETDEWAEFDREDEEDAVEEATPEEPEAGADAETMSDSETATETGSDSDSGTDTEPDSETDTDSDSEENVE